MTSPRSAVVFDHTALLALGAGNRHLSRIVSPAHRRPGRRVYVPALCLAAATAARPALGEHVGALSVLEVVELGYADAVMVGRAVANGCDWRTAHALALGRPDLEWPGGRPVLTATPQAYADHGVTTIPVPAP